jgi:hypothetical protein
MPIEAPALVMLLVPSAPSILSSEKSEAFPWGVARRIAAFALLTASSSALRMVPDTLTTCMTQAWSTGRGRRVTKLKAAQTRR